ncbi:MAG: hypothetical protein HZB43_10505 [candidate division Zixibacteria bacterium]|nr:hypothetical protein [candidate division Zixibacteria bacterium]
MAVLLIGAAVARAQSGRLTRLTLEPIHKTILKDADLPRESLAAPQAEWDFGLFYEHGILQLVLNDPPSSSWKITFDSLPGMFAQPDSGFFTAPGVQYCNIYLDRTALPFRTYHGTITVTWSIPATDLLPTRFQVADTLVNGAFAPANVSPLTAGLSYNFMHRDTVSLWSASFGTVYFEIRADGSTVVGSDLTGTAPYRGIFMWIPDNTVTVPSTASTLWTISRLTIGSALDGDDSARIIYNVAGTHYPPQCLQAPDVKIRCDDAAQNQFQYSGTDPVKWRQIFGPGITDSLTGLWQWNPGCADTGTYVVAAAMSSNYFPNADTCSFQVTILDSAGFRFALGDADCNGTVDVLDIVGIIDYVFNNQSICYSLLADWDCNGLADVFDLIAIIDYAFNGGPGSNATALVSAPASVPAGDTAMFVASTCLPGRESEIQWQAPDGSPSVGSGPIFKTIFATPGIHISTFECCEGKPDTVTVTVW